MELLTDLTTLSLFEGTRVPAAPLNGMCMSLFGQLLTHPSRVTFPWSALRHALTTYFGTQPHLIDPQKIGSGWNGLALILTAFKRLEVVEQVSDTEQVLLWLTHLKAATVKRSLSFEITTATTLQDILANLIEPVTEEEIALARARTTNSKPIPPAPPAAAMTYDPFAFDDVSNVGSSSTKKGDNKKRARGSIAAGGEDGDEDEASKRSKTGGKARASIGGGKKTVSSSNGDGTVMVEGPDGEIIRKMPRIQRPHDPNRPNYSYSALIGQAILTHPEKKLRLGEIYDFVTHNYEYYKKNECGWQNSIRHNLSLQPVFKKIPDNSIPGKKSCFWTILPTEEWRFANGGWQKLEKGQPLPPGAHEKHKRIWAAAAAAAERKAGSPAPSGGGKGKGNGKSISASGASSPTGLMMMDYDDGNDSGDGALYSEDDM